MAIPAIGPITEVALERLCFGCRDPYRVAFFRDGRATRTDLGNARLRTTDTHWTGRVDPGDFIRLERAIDVDQFKALLAEYRDPDLADGVSITITVRGDSIDKSVLSRNDAGPALLKALQTEIETVKARVAWSPAAP